MYFERFCEERGIKKKTIKSYRTTINTYTRYYNLTFDELIQEAIDEENDPEILRRNRSIKNRFLQFRTHLLNETNLKKGTIRKHMIALSTLYGHFDIELPKLPPLKEDKVNETTYYDLPTKEQISMAVDMSGIRIGSMILFMASSGTARKECENLTVGDFINACRDYYTKDTLPEIIEEIYGSIEPVVPTLQILRQKTGKKYYTFCTPQAAHAIAEWLLLRLEICEANDKELTLDDSLWGFTERQITYHFSSINDQLEFGFGHDGYRFFRPHTLRKFHSSNIGLEETTIDLLQGRSKDKLHETYIKTNPERYKKVYMNVMDNVTIGKTTKEIKHEEFHITINVNLFGTEYAVNI